MYSNFPIVHKLIKCLAHHTHLDHIRTKDDALSTKSNQQLEVGRNKTNRIGMIKNKFTVRGTRSNEAIECHRSKAFGSLLRPYEQWNSMMSFILGSTKWVLPTCTTRRTVLAFSILGFARLSQIFRPSVSSKLDLFHIFFIFSCREKDIELTLL